MFKVRRQNSISNAWSYGTIDSIEEKEILGENNNIML